MTVEGIEDCERDYCREFLSVLVELMAPYTEVVFMCLRQTPYTPQPRLVAVLTTGHGFSLKFKRGCFGLEPLRLLPKALKLIVVQARWLELPQLDSTLSARGAAEKWWAEASRPIETELLHSRRRSGD